MHLKLYVRSTLAFDASSPSSHLCRSSPSESALPPRRLWLQTAPFRTRIPRYSYVRLA